MRVVGLSLESTTEGGGGPSFAAGNTRLGETEKQAVAPKDVTPPPSGVSDAAGALAPGRTNQIASRIPVDGITYVKAKRKVNRPPPFPPTLKSQGIEGQVSVMVSVDATGKVTKVKIIKPSPYPEFNEAARTSALADEYEPETRNGVPMATTLVFDYQVPPGGRMNGKGRDGGMADGWSLGPALRRVGACLGLGALVAHGGRGRGLRH